VKQWLIWVSPALVRLYFDHFVTWWGWRTTHQRTMFFYWRLSSKNGKGPPTPSRMSPSGFPHRKLDQVHATLTCACSLLEEWETALRRSHGLLAQCLPLSMASLWLDNFSRQTNCNFNIGKGAYHEQQCLPVLIQSEINKLLQDNRDIRVTPSVIMCISGSMVFRFPTYLTLIRCMSLRRSKGHTPKK